MEREADRYKAEKEEEKGWKRWFTHAPPAGERKKGDDYGSARFRFRVQNGVVHVCLTVDLYESVSHSVNKHGDTPFKKIKKKHMNMPNQATGAPHSGNQWWLSSCWSETKNENPEWWNVSKALKNKQVSGTDFTHAETKVATKVPSDSTLDAATHKACSRTNTETVGHTLKECISPTAFPFLEFQFQDGCHSYIPRAVLKLKLKLCL